MTVRYSLAKTKFKASALGNGFAHNYAIHSYQLTPDGSNWVGTVPSAHTPLQTAQAWQSLIASHYDNTVGISSVTAVQPRTSTHGELYIATYGSAITGTGTASTAVPNAWEIIYTCGDSGGFDGKMVFCDTIFQTLKKNTVSSVNPVTSAAAVFMLTENVVSFNANPFIRFISWSVTINRTLKRHYKL